MAGHKEYGGYMQVEFVEIVNFRKPLSALQPNHRFYII